jgi:hypothetical protein
MQQVPSTLITGSNSFEPAKKIFSASGCSVFSSSSKKK